MADAQQKNTSPASRKTDRKILVLATGNPDKVSEMQSLLKATGWKVHALREIAGDVDIEETGVTLDENAEIKARFVCELTGLPSLADDTGLEVDALGGRPGVKSARYAGPSSDAVRNRKKLLEEMLQFSDPDQRTARFRTVLAYVDPGGTDNLTIRKYEGVCSGKIITEERGRKGFGYDPLFEPDEGSGLTFAEMDPDRKNSISHRGRALQKFLEAMAGHESS